MNLAALSAIRGELPPTVHLPLEYFQTRGIVMDCKGPLEISAESHWGIGVRVLTRSHEFGNSGPEAVVPRPVIVERDAWIGSYALLYNCRIGEGAVVAAGAVVRSCEVAPGVMVAGNPARVIARYSGGRWVYEEPRWRRLE